LSGNIEDIMSDYDLAPDDLYKHPELLDNILSSQAELMMLSLEQARASGVFIILNATVSRRQFEALFSRAGLHFVYHEPIVVEKNNFGIRLQRGSPKIAMKYKLIMSDSWTMEFNIGNANYFMNTQKLGAMYPELQDRLFYWNPSAQDGEKEYDAMKCCAPLIDSYGNTFGVCGMEISDKLFKYTYLPSDNIINNIFCAIMPFNGRSLDATNALLSWRYTIESEQDLAGLVQIVDSQNGLNTYQSDNGTLFVGRQKIVKLYPDDSPLAANQYAFVLLTPKEDYDAFISKNNRTIAGFILLILLLGAFVSYFFSKWYIMPIARFFEMMKEGMRNGTTPQGHTKISEIDDLMQFLNAERNRKIDAETLHAASLLERAGEDEAILVSEFFEEFEQNVKTLSRAEASVFNLYVEGHTAEEIAEILSLSINTIKTHNKNIFSKMNVSSRYELLTGYIKMLRAKNKPLRKQ
jgi:DNA-binding CsgD family transcriptional regulator